MSTRYTCKWLERPQVVQLAADGQLIVTYSTQDPECIQAAIEWLVAQLNQQDEQITNQAEQIRMLKQLNSVTPARLPLPGLEALSPTVASAVAGRAQIDETLSSTVAALAAAAQSLGLLSQQVVRKYAEQAKAAKPAGPGT